MFGQKGSGAACEVPQTVSDFSCCKGKQIAAAGVFYSLSCFACSFSFPHACAGARRPTKKQKGPPGPFLQSVFSKKGFYFLAAGFAALAGAAALAATLGAAFATGATGAGAGAAFSAAR